LSSLRGNKEARRRMRAKRVAEIGGIKACLRARLGLVVNSLLRRAKMFGHFLMGSLSHKKDLAEEAGEEGARQEGGLIQLSSPGSVIVKEVKGGRAASSKSNEKKGGKIKKK